MRILMTTDTVGGVWTFTEELATALLQHGCAICLVSIGRPASAAQQSWCDRMQSSWQDWFRYEHVDAPLEWMQSNEGAYKDAAPHLLALIEEFNAELLHSNQFCFGALPLDMPKIVTAHSDVFSWAQACRGGALPPSDWLTRYSSLVTRGLRQADAVTAPTRWMATSLANTFALPQTPAVIPNGRTLSPATEVGKRKLQAVTAGRLWDEAKNISLLAGVQSPMPILVAGESEHDSAAMTATPDNATMLGTLGSEELLALFRESAIYICTSRYEPFGLAPLEAALCGCAVLAYDIPSLREVWNSAALYFDSGHSLSLLLHRLDNDVACLTAAQEQSLARAGTFTAERMASGYYRLFEGALAAHEDIVYAS
jgi:glycosyltransferase involved in cell wall biosynthesis